MIMTMVFLIPKSIKNTLFAVFLTQLYVLSKYDGRDLWNVETA